MLGALGVAVRSPRLPSWTVMGTADKAALRTRLLAARRAAPAEVRAAEVHTLQQHLTWLAMGAATVCAYVPVGAEPGAIAMLDALWERKLRVLLPVARTTSEDVP